RACPQRSARSLHDALPISGVAKMSLYRSFPSKDALVAAWLEDRDQFFWQRWERAEAKRAGDPRGQLEAILDMVAVTASHPKWRRSEEHTSELQSRVDLVCR